MPYFEILMSDYVPVSNFLTGLNEEPDGLVENGKLRLYRGDRSCDQSYWQSFDHLTDTFFPGQKLYKGDTLRASASAEEWGSAGKYHFQMQSDHFNAFVLEADKQMNYFQLVPKEANHTGLNRRRDAEAEAEAEAEALALGEEITVEKASVGQTNRRTAYIALPPRGNVTKQGAAHGTRTCDGRGETTLMPSTYAALDGENLVLAITTENHIFRMSPDSAAGSYRYLRLGSDGRLTTYQWQEDDLPRKVYELVALQVDACQLPQACGDYGVCSRGGVNCRCPEARNGSTYLQPMDKRDPEQGCSPMTTYSCKAPSDMVDFGNLSHFSFIDNHSAEGDARDLQGCKEKCQGDCRCRAAFFKFRSSTSDGECYMVLSEMLSIRADPIPGLRPYNSAAFIKVQLPSSPPVRNLGSPPPSETPSQDSSSTSRTRTNLVAILLGSLAAVFAFFISALCIVISRKKGKKNKEKEQRKSEGEDNFNPKLRMPRRFSYEELRVATEDFKDRLGRGGFGTVFRGELEDSTRIAVKGFDSRGQGMKEFLAEVETVGNIHHVHLVRLIGFCTERSCKPLVYEYMNNGSLDAWIFNSQRNLDIDWQTRKKIILGIAKGLTFLHEECFQRIVHLDIKPQNILLDDDFNAKISDFGLSKQMDRDQSQVQTTIRGTPGYLAPEWRQLRITLKVYVCSFGIVVLEIICGRKNLDSSRSESSEHLLRLLQEKDEAGRLMDIAEGSRTDTQLHGDEMLRMIMLAIWCLQDDPVKLG
ncbi:hypothetical protein ACLOJK_010664 [Asimina triloba]